MKQASYFQSLEDVAVLVIASPLHPKEKSVYQLMLLEKPEAGLREHEEISLSEREISLSHA
jgi:hypothetical protein